MSQRITLNSANTAVVISDSPAFKTQDESGFVFAGVNSLSYGFNNVRADTSQLGSQDSYDENIIRQPDVNLKMSYGFSPTFANEELMGLIYNLDAKSKFSITKGLTESSSNFYLYNHPEQEQDALEYIKNGAFPNGGEIVSIGNAYLTNYSMNFALGAFPTVDVEFDCSNIKIENYSSQLIESPAINLESGNNVGVGSMNILDTKYYEPSKFGGLYNLDRTKIETILPKDINFQMDNLTIGGQKLELENHRINQFSVTVPLQRSNSYRLGSDYVCSRKLNYPIKATLSISSLVTNLEAGFISGLVKGDQISNLRIISTDCQKKVTSQFYFEDIKLENVDYQTLVNEQTNYNLEFSFQITDKKGFKTAVTEQDIRDTRFIDDTNQVYEYIKGPVIANWQSGDLSGYKVAFGEVTDYGVFDGAFQDCVNIDKPVFLPEQINYFGNDVFNGCINLPDFYSDSTCQILSFGDRAFKDCSSLEEIVLPIRLEEVGAECFMGCSSATDLFLADVQSIGEKAFFNCSGLSESLYLPDSLSGLGESAFENCSGMEGGLYISKSLTRIEDKTFKNAKLLSFDLTIPDNVLSIGFEAFYGCEGFDGELILSSGLSEIEDYVFYGCNSLNGYLNIPGNVIEIGSSAFEGCSGFDKEVSFPGVEIIGANAFSGCSSLTGKLSFASGISTIGDNAFMGCDSLGYSLTIPSGIQSIGDRSFSGCSGIQDVYVNFPFNVFQGDEAFAGVRGCMYVTPFYYNGYKQNTVDGLYQGMPVCYGSLDTIVFDANTAETIKFKRGDIPSGWYSNQSRDSLLVIGSTCKNIEPGAFDGSNGLQGLFVVPDELESIGDFAFRGCSFEGELIIPDTIEYLGSGAFEDCSGFNDILLIGDGINEIKAKTFKNCSSINSDIILSPEIISIGDEAFYNCNSISGDLSLGISLSYIGDYAFYNCSSAIGDLEIPEDVTYVGDYAFYNCSSLDGEFISIEAAGLSYIGNYAFQDCSLMTGSLTMPASVSYIGSGAFKNCRGLAGEIDLTLTQINEINEESFFGCSGLIGLLVVPDSVQFIGDRAFLGCSSLTESITITNIAARNIGTDAFDSPIQFDELIISDSVREVSQYEFDYFKNDPLYLTMQEGLTTINEYSFSNYAFIGDLDIPLTLRYVGDASFSGCEFGGTYLFEDSNIEYIGNYAFYDLDLINGNIQVPNVTYVGDGAFFNNSSIDGYITFGDLTSGIGEYAFANCSSAIGDLTLPDNISYLGQFAFLNCSSLSGTLTLPNNEGYNIIKTGTFKNCSLLSGDLVIHDYISGIEQEAFLGCSSLSGDITITDVCASTLVGSNAFDDSPFSKLIISDSVVNIENGEFDYFSTRAIEVVFQDGLSGILDNAFDNYSFVSEINLPSSITGIGNSAFENCDGLYGPLTIPDNASGIGEDAFRSCINLSGNLIIPNRMPNIGDGAFVNCSSLNGYIRISDLTASAISSYINVFGGTNFDELRATSSDLIIEDGEFDSFNAFVGALFLEPSVLDVGDYAFVDNFSFADTLTISENSEIIGDYAFSGNSFIGDLDINSESIGYASFAECSSLDGEFTINSATLSKVDDYAFYNCSNLSGNLFIGESLSGIGNYSFSNMTNLDGEFELCGLPEDFEGLLSEYKRIEESSPELEFEEFVTTDLKYFRDYAFANNSNLSGNLVIPDTTTSWGEYAFLNMSSLDGFLILGSGVNSIPEGIFKNCSGLNCYGGLFKIPDNVSLIGAEAFYNCSSLDCVLRLKPGVTILTDAFFGTNFNGLLVPSGTIAILDGDYDTFQNTELRLIFEQPDSAFRTLGDLAFDNYRLTGNLLLPESTDYIGSSGFLNCDLINGSFSVPLATEIIGDSAFRNCSGFDGDFSLVDLPNSYNGQTDLSTALSGIGDYAFANCQNWTGNLVIPDGVNYGKFSFLNNSSLDGFLILNDTTEIIPEGAFKGCTQIGHYQGQTLTIPRVVTFIGTEAFYNCLNLLGGDIRIGADPIIGTDAFFGQDFDNLIVPSYEEILQEGDYEYFKDLSIGLQFDGWVNGSSLISIEEKAFLGYSFTGSLTLPNSLSGIGSSGFKDCSLFEGSLFTSSNLITIGDSAFENCYGFTGGLSFQNGIESIGFRSFAGCSGFDGEYNFSNASNLDTIGHYAFANCINLVGDLNIPDGIEWGEYAFLNNRSLDGNLILGEGIDEIPEGSFKGCSLIQAPNARLEIPRSVDLIGDYAFQGSDLILLGEIKIKGGVDIGIDALEPFNFGTLIVPDYEVTLENADYEYFKPKNIQLEFENYISSDLRILQNNCFSGYNFLGNLQLPYLLETIGNYAFYEASGFDGDLIISPNLGTIGEQAFYNCSGFDGEFRLVNLPANYNGETNLNSSLSVIGRNAFANCTSWTGNLVIPDGVICQDFAFLNNHSLDGFLILNNTATTINEGVFQDCSGLKCFEGVFKIPESVTFIDRDAFKNCVSLDCKLQISSDVFIGSNAFAGTNFQGLVVPEYVEEILSGDYDYFKNDSITIDFENYNSASNQTITIGDNAFEGYNFIGELKLPNALETIGDRAFYGLDTLEGGLIIPDSVTSIGSGAFENCSGLFGSFLFPRSIQNIGPYAFKNCKDLVYNPKFDPGLVSIGEEAFSNCISLNGIVELPIGTQSIGSGAFLNASGLGGILITSFGVSVFDGENAFSGVGGVLQLSPEVYLEYENASTEINGDYYFQGIKISGQIANDTIFFTGSNEDRINAVEDEVDGRLTDTNNQGYAIPNNWKQGLTSDPAYGGINTQVINSWIEIGGLCEAISSEAFMDRKYLRDLVSIPQSVRTIGSRAFKGCTGVTELDFTWYGVEDIREEAFTGLVYVTSDIELPYTLSNLGEKAFYNVTRAGDLTMKGNLLETIPFEAFYNYGANSPNKTIKLNSGLLEISGGAFYNAGGVGTSLELSDTIQTIGYRAFYSYGGGTSASQMGSINDLPRDLTSMGDEAFYSTTITGNINIPSGLNILPYRSFYNSWITTVSGLSGLDEIERDAFSNSEISNDIIISDNTFLAISCFSTCTNIKHVSLSGNYPYDTAVYSGGIDWRGFQFYNNYNLRTLHTSGIQQIPYYFANGGKNLVLDEYSLGYDETSGINAYSFQSVASDYNGIVNNYPQQSRICIPSGVVEIGISAFDGNTVTEKITYSGSQSGLIIGQSAFQSLGAYNYNTRWANYGEPGERSYYYPTGPNSFWPETNVTGYFVTPSGMRYLGNGAFQSFRGRAVDIIFADDFTGSILPGVTVNDRDSLRYKTNSSNGGGNNDGGYWRMHPTSTESNVFYRAQLKSLHLPSGLQRIGNYAMSEFTIMDHNDLDLPLNPKTIGDYACYTLNCETGDGVFTLEMGSGLESIGTLAFSNKAHPLNNGLNGTVNDSSNLTIPPLAHKISGVRKLHRCVESIDFSNVSGAVSFGDRALERSWLSGVLELPQINTMGTQVFKYAHYLEQIVFKSSPNFTNIPNSTFANLLGLSGVVFNEELTSMGSNVFENCPSLVDFDISLTAIESMGDSVFKNCANLANIDLANGDITTLGAKVFENCTSIDDLYIPNSITSVGSDLFLNANINSLFYDVAGTVLEAGLFNGSTIGTLQLPTATITVKESVFENCIFGPDPFNGLPNGVQTFESRVFFGIGLSGVDIPTSLTGFVNETFRNASNLTGLDMTACTSFEGIGNDNFIGCTSLEEVVFPASMLSMGDRNFKGLNQIEEVSLGNGLEIMGNNNYQNCSGLTFVNLANTSLIEIGDDNFIEDSNTKVIASLEFPSTLEIIGSRNFKDITVDTLILPNNIKTIGDENFYDCQPSNSQIWDGVGGAGDNLFIIPSSIETMGNYNWYQSDGIQRLKIEAGSSGSIGDYNWNKCNQLSELFIKTTDSNFTLGEENFSDNNLLELVEIDCPLSSWVGTGNLRASKFNVVVKINSAYHSSYINSTWSGDQGLPIESSIISYNP
jgi:hypothetical protein